ncbi:MAG: DUF2953 domain-containing protein [Oscillospiraceae bacterium]
MKVLFILACIVLALFLLSLIRVGGEVLYDSGGLIAKLKVCGLKFTVYPVKPSKKPPKPPKEKKAKEEPTPPREKRTLGGSLALVKEFLPLVGEAAGKLKRKISVDRIALHLVWGGEDPADCAMGYGYANVALGMIWPILEQNFNIHHRDIHTDIDFNQKSPTVYVNAVLTLTIGQCLVMGISLGTKAFSVYRKNQKQRTKEARSHDRTRKPEPSHR